MPIERDFPSQELLPELRTPSELYEQALRTLSDEATIVAAKPYRTIEKATEAAEAFDHRVTTHLETILNFSSIEVVLSGDEILVPTLSVRPFNDEDTHEVGIKVVINADEPLRLLDGFEEVRATIIGAWHSTKEVNGSYYACPYVIADLIDVTKSEIEFSESDYNLIELDIRKKAFIALHSSTEIAIKELTEIRQKQHLIDTVARYGMTNSMFRYQLSKLGQILYGENTDSFKDLKNMKILKKAASLGALHARKGFEYAETASAAFVNVLGVGRTVSVSISDEKADGIFVSHTIYGDIISVLMPHSDDDEQEPSFLIKVFPLSDTETQMTQVPISSITRLSF